VSLIANSLLRDSILSCRVLFELLVAVALVTRVALRVILDASHSTGEPERGKGLPEMVDVGQMQQIRTLERIVSEEDGSP